MKPLSHALDKIMRRPRNRAKQIAAHVQITVTCSTIQSVRVYTDSYVQVQSCKKNYEEQYVHFLQIMRTDPGKSKRSVPR